jgi:hypothetical protein
MMLQKNASRGTVDENTREWMSLQLRNSFMYVHFPDMSKFMYIH